MISQTIHHPNSVYICLYALHIARELNFCIISVYGPGDHCTSPQPHHLVASSRPDAEVSRPRLLAASRLFFSTVCLSVLSIAGVVLSRRRSNRESTKTGISIYPPVYTACPKAFDIVWISHLLVVVVFALGMLPSLFNSIEVFRGPTGFVFGRNHGCGRCGCTLPQPSSSSRASLGPSFSL
ncbi:hypothetical protein N657DRAFT_244164 [Parathielavia appendiculata]|uniref:Uncharacterized protein n=1 Tax=Parathielavia appendiculata TaxID=2587402 RepID=A0AAN6TT10_9PEZI|nr:hypothetical protein N657DRAFT_244164 [Parathielavia appendiculata]